MRRLLLLACLLGSALLAHAHDFRIGDARLIHPYATPTPPMAQVGAAYLGIANQGTEDLRLVAVRSELSEVVELHDMVMENGVMLMRKVPYIDIPAGETLQMQQGGGHHLMLIGLKAPLRTGEQFPLWLTFEGLGEIQVEVWVEARALPDHQPMQSHPHH